jgi:hypothetical protein
MSISAPSTSTLCVLDVGGREVHLSARHEGADVWRWKILFKDGLTLQQGAMTTRLAAQVAAQQAFEYRLGRSGVYLENFTGYRWNEVVG